MRGERRDAGLQPHWKSASVSPQLNLNQAVLDCIIALASFSLILFKLLLLFISSRNSHPSLLATEVVKMTRLPMTVFAEGCFSILEMSVRVRWWLTFGGRWELRSGFLVLPGMSLCCLSTLSEKRESIN